MNREDFPVLNNKNIIYFDNAATTLKPSCVLTAMNEYYEYYTANIHRGLYDSARLVDYLYDSTRYLVSDFIHSSSAKEIIFTTGATHSINLVVFGYMKNHLKEGDEVLLSKAEHASNILPWLVLARNIGIHIKYIPLSSDYSLHYEDFLSSVTPRTKVVSLAHITNVVGDERDIYRIGEFCSTHHILFHIDGAQSVPHVPVDFKKSKADFLSFSLHKMCGPTGVGVLVVKEELLSDMEPVFYGGGMNESFDSFGNYTLKEAPLLFEAGTPPIGEVLGLRVVISYLLSIGMERIARYERKLKRYLVEELQQVPGIVFYYTSSDTGILIFNIRGVSSSDVCRYLNMYHICARAGNHCSKMLKDEIGALSTVRISLYFYNTKEEIDTLVQVLKNCQDVFREVG